MSKNLYKGTLTTVILKLLHDNNRMYGYEMTKKTQEQTNNGFKITEGALYSTLHKMEAENVLDVEYEMINGRSRKYYKLSKKGEKEAILQIEELKVFIKNLTNFIELKPL